MANLSVLEALRQVVLYVKEYVNKIADKKLDSDSIDVENINTQLKTLDSRLGVIAASAGNDSASSSEIQDARVSYGNVQYESLGNHIRAIESGAALKSGSVGTSALADASVTPEKLSENFMETFYTAAQVDDKFTEVIPSGKIAPVVQTASMTQSVGIGEDGKLYTNPSTIDATLTQAGQAADAAAVRKELDSLSEEIANLNTDGISATARNLLITILRNGVYSSDQKANITALETALASSGGGSGDGSGGDAETVIYTVTNKLTNVVNSNSSKSVTEGSSYVANLTADEGYSIDSVSVLMGGVDVTAAVYANGVLVINSITGDIVITATAIETIDDNFVWVVGTTESTGKWQKNLGQRLTPYKKNGTFVAFTATDDNMRFGDYRGDLYLATIPEGSTLLTVPEHDATWIIAPAIFNANGTRLADPGYNTATIDLTQYPTAVYYGANLKPSDNAVSESDYATVNASITDFVFS